MSATDASPPTADVEVGSAPAGRDDSRVIRALDAYLAAAEEGRPPDRAAFLREHAEIATELAACLDGLDLVQSIASRLQSPKDSGTTSGRSSDLAPSTCLGDYRILREVGRGGMGIVYEAEQISLGRRVALKVLPFAAAMDPRQLQRFKLEAQAAAQIHHTNIVPVFAVGCDRGVHYYAMQFIDGYSLADVIRELRQADGESYAKSPDATTSQTASNPSRARKTATRPTLPTTLGPRSAGPTGHGEAGGGSSSTLGLSARTRTFYRSVALLGGQAAAALEHAHNLGVVHRDVKPANLMLDTRGNLWITDFGLARFQEDTGLTLTGDLLGTLRYMSPEQALGRPTIVDHRADIYSLGVTLYELVTLRPAFEGRDRVELLRQIADEDPIAPRRIDPAIPRELETIILKAMAKEPHERYASAQQLADDLQRFLDDKPIQARRPSPIDQAVKWSRRHRTVVASAAILLFMAVVGLSVATFLLARERDIADAERQNAVKNLRMTQRAINEMHALITEKGPSQDAEMADLQHKFLKVALVYYRQIAQQWSTDPVRRRERALAFRNIGDIEYRFGRPDEAERAYRQALSLLEDLGSDPDAESPVAIHDAAMLSKSLGRLLQATIRDEEAEVFFRRAIGIQGRYVQQSPDVESQGRLAELHLDLGVLLENRGLDRRSEAIAEFRAALELARGISDRLQAEGRRPVDRLDAQALVAVIDSHLYEVLGSGRDAVSATERAIRLYDEVHRIQPSRPEARTKLAHAYFRLSWLRSMSDDPEIHDQESAAKLAEEAVRLEPQNASYHHKRGVMLMAAGNLPEAEAAFRRVLELVPDSPNAHNSLAWLLAAFAGPVKRDPQVAVTLARKAVESASQVGIFWNTLGVALYRAGDYAGSVRALERSMSLRGGGDSFDWYYLAMAQWQLGRADVARSWFRKAAEWRLKHRPSDPELSLFHAVAAELLSLASDEPVRLSSKGRPQRRPQATSLGSVRDPGSTAKPLPGVAGTVTASPAPPVTTTIPSRTSGYREPVRAAPVPEMTSPKMLPEATMPEAATSPVAPPFHAGRSFYA
jgi:serine/threonine protein kinase/Flp pilus assembly protein TadD